MKTRNLLEASEFLMPLSGVETFKLVAVSESICENVMPVDIALLVVFNILI